MRILLVNPPCDPRTIGLRHMAKIEPLGLEVVGAAVADEHEVLLVDMEVAPEDLDAALDSFAPDVVGVTSEIVHVHTALDVLARVRERYPSCLTVVGGHHATMHAEDFATPVVDVIVIGEGALTFREICEIHASGGTDFSSVSGLAIPSGPGRVKRTRARPLPVDMDAYPQPDRSLTARYRKRYFYIHESSVAAVRTSFGCTHHCTFCSVRVYSQGKFFARSPESVYEEIRAIEEDFILFCDDHSFLDAERMRRLGELLIEGDVKKRYFAYARADSIVAHRDVFALWARAGLSIVMSGLEAMDSAALKRSGKQTSAGTNEEAVRIAEELGFGISAGFLVEPDFERADFERIDRYARERPSIFIVEYTALTPFPGTPLFKKESKRLLTHDPALFDLQHFVMPTRLPTRELYKLMLEYHSRASWRVVRRLLRKRPQVFLSPHVTRLVPGLLANARAYREAHLHAPDRRVEEDAPTSLDGAPLSASYEGWSGWRIDAGRHPPVLFDPAPDTEWPDDRTVVCLTHGHPEHIEATLHRLRQTERPPMTVVASKPLCMWIDRRVTLHPGDLLRAVLPGDDLHLEGWSLHVFEWDHMPLIPPEPRRAVHHLQRLLRHPRKLGRVVIDGLVGPPHGPTFGYVATGGGHRVVYYGEGLHRRLDPRVLQAVVGSGSDTTLIAGLEPEDTEALPPLLALARPAETLLFEPHGAWRSSFGLSRIDDGAVRASIEHVGLHARVVQLGETVSVGRNGVDEGLTA